MARSTLPGRSLDPGSNVGARRMITLSGSSGETEPGLQTRFRSFFPFSPFALFAHELINSSIFHFQHPQNFPERITSPVCLRIRIALCG